MCNFQFTPACGTLVSAPNRALSFYSAYEACSLLDGADYGLTEHTEHVAPKALLLYVLALYLMLTWLSRASHALHFSRDLLPLEPSYRPRYTWRSLCPQSLLSISENNAEPVSIALALHL